MVEPNIEGQKREIWPVSREKTADEREKGRGIDRRVVGARRFVGANGWLTEKKRRG
jgi:hypothetical protein